MIHTISFTVDVEHDCPPYRNTVRGLVEGLPRLLTLLAEQNLPATFFVTGEIARHYPHLVETLVTAGHELGSHGNMHRDFRKLSWAEAESEIRDSVFALRQFAQPRAFRAPYLQFPNHYLPLLEAHGFTHDSSQARYKLNAYQSSTTNLRRIPVSMTSSFLRLPRFLTLALLQRLPDPLVLFVHPWEFVDWRRTRLRWDCRFNTGEIALKCVRDLLQHFKTHGARFVPLTELCPA